MKCFLFVFFTLIEINIYAQQFSSDIYLSDANGNSDTITLGYDANATDSIDLQFSEVNIVNKPWDSVFEARISPLSQYVGPINNFTPPYQTKKQILNYNPQPPFSPLSIQFSTPVFIEVYSRMGRPFSLHWNKMLFADSSRMRSGFFFINGINLPRYVVDNDSLIFYDWYSDNSYYLKNNDTIWLLGFSFFSYSEVGINDNFQLQIDPIIAYPNPTKGIIHIAFTDNPQMNIKMQIFDITGRFIRDVQVIKQKNFTLDISDLQKGIYILNIKSNDEFSKSIKIIKN